jgi:hypothetical protein
MSVKSLVSSAIKMWVQNFTRREISKGIIESGLEPLRSSPNRAAKTFYYSIYKDFRPKLVS